MTMMPQRMTMIALGVKDLRRAMACCQALGRQAEESNDMAAFFAMRGQKLGLFTLAGLAHETGLDEGRPGTGAMTLSQNHRDEAAVDAAWSAAVEAGATPLARPRKADWGGYSGYVADPDGHVWEYAFNPWWVLDKDGLLQDDDDAASRDAS